MSRGSGGKWPTSRQYNEAVQNLRTSMCDEELQAGTAAVNARGGPLLYSGGFADVYQVHCPQTDNTWAVKFFKYPVRDQCERYAAISQHLRQTRLGFTVDFAYQDSGVRIEGGKYPLVKIRWVEGLRLNEFVAGSFQRPHLLEQLGRLWVKLAGRLSAAGMAHADLQHGNVLLVPQENSDGLLLRLIDYDGMYVPALAGRGPAETGHANYQHPWRKETQAYGVEVDRFSHLAISCALRALLSGGRELWDRFNTQDNLLFVEQDFLDPGNSVLLRELWALPDPAVRSLVGHLVLATKRPLEQTPRLEDLVSHDQVQPLNDGKQRAVARLLEGALPPVVQETPAAIAPAVSPVEPNAPAPVVVAVNAHPKSGTRKRNWLAWSRLVATPILALDRHVGRWTGRGWLHQGLRVAALSLLVLGTIWLLTAARSRWAGPAPGSDVELVTVGSVEPTTASPQGDGDAKVELITNSLGMQLRRIPAGEFWMGSPPEEAGHQGNEGPRHQVRITRDFYLGVHEVTQGQYGSLMGTRPWSGQANVEEGSDYPASYVSWEDAAEFCRKLSVQEGRTYRLPTEAEWEYACRGGTTTAYAFGDDVSLLGDYAWYRDSTFSSERYAHEVGKKRANDFGLYDMHGNVWEWCQDWSSEYPSGTVSDPTGPPTGSYRVYRGGSWSSSSSGCRAAYHNGSWPGYRYFDFGFRVAAVPSGQ